jgi:hypothetical protein
VIITGTLTYLLPPVALLASFAGACLKAPCLQGHVLIICLTHIAKEFVP